MRLIDHKKIINLSLAFSCGADMVLEQCHRLNNGSLSCPQTCEDLDPTEGDCERCVYHPVHSLIEKKLTVGVTQLLFIVVRKVKDPNWPETNQLAIYNVDWGVMGWNRNCSKVLLGISMNQSELKANACIGPSAGNVWEQGRIGCFSTPDGLKKWRKFFRPTAKRGKNRDKAALSIITSTDIPLRQFTLFCEGAHKRVD